MVSNRQARAATKAYIKYKLGLGLSDAERRALQLPEIIKVVDKALEGVDLGEGGEAKASAAVG